MLLVEFITLVLQGKEGIGNIEQGATPSNFRLLHLKHTSYQHYKILRKED